MIAERAAAELGLHVRILERRPHIAGNCYDHVDANGLLVHAYGPHYFRARDADLISYLSRFTEWIPGNYRVRSLVKGELLPFPINLTTLERFFGRDLTPDSARDLLQSKAEAFDRPGNSEEYVLSRVGRELYEAFYLGYTIKQWGRHPSALDPSVCGRIPVRLDRDDRYVEAPFQQMPAAGYSALFRRMIHHPRIELWLGVDYREVRYLERPRYATVYCGPLDEYFDHRLGALPWRSLRFEQRTFDSELVQPCVQINYPDERPYTRTVEIKHVTGQRHPSTVVTYEFPQATGDPYYPVPGRASADLQRRYLELAGTEERLRKVFFTGRLASYRYVNADEAMLEALATFERMKPMLSAAPLAAAAPGI